MNIVEMTMPSFFVIGKEGSTEDGQGFVQRLWENANSNFREVEPLAERNEDGSLAGVWGAMTDFSRSFQPWEENFSRGLYLAGIQCREDAQPPEGWTKWQIPGFTCLAAECDRETVFRDMLAYLKEEGIPLSGAVQDYTDPRTGKSYMLFPVKKKLSHRTDERSV